MLYQDSVSEIYIGFNAEYYLDHSENRLTVDFEHLFKESCLINFDFNSPRSFQITQVAILNALLRRILYPLSDAQISYPEIYKKLNIPKVPEKAFDSIDDAIFFIKSIKLKYFKNEVGQRLFGYSNLEFDTINQQNALIELEDIYGSIGGAFKLNVSNTTLLNKDQFQIVHRIISDANLRDLLSVNYIDSVNSTDYFIFQPEWFDSENQINLCNYFDLNALLNTESLLETLEWIL